MVVARTSELTGGRGSAGLVIAGTTIVAQSSTAFWPAAVVRATVFASATTCGAAAGPGPPQPASPEIEVARTTIAAARLIGAAFHASAATGRRSLLPA